MRGLFLTAAVLLLATPAIAQEAAKPAAKQPIEITADTALEWHRNDKTYIAKGSAIAKQGLTELHGDTLTAAYVDGKDKKGMTITRIDAVGNVTVMSDGSTATGDQGFYDVASGYSELTGNNLMLQTKTDKVTARDKLTYDANKSQLNAIGAAKAVRGDDVITSDRLIGYFTKDAQGNSKLRELQGVGNVVITTPTDVLHGDNGVYDAATNKATITGNVRIDRGPNVITGAHGEVDLNTNISRMFGSTESDKTGTGDGRVRGVFYPE